MSDTPRTDELLMRFTMSRYVSMNDLYAEKSRALEELCAELEREYRVRCRRADSIILMLTADHNSGPHYVKGFDMAQEYFQDFPHD